MAFATQNQVLRAWGTYFDRMRQFFRTRAETLGYEVIDLDRYFFSRHKRSGERFE